MVIRLGKTQSNPFPNVRLEGDRIFLRPPVIEDWRDWAELREQSRVFLEPWEPAWPPDAHSRTVFQRRVRRQIQEWRDGAGYSFFFFRQGDERLLGGIGLSNVRRGVAQAGTLGYWIGQPFARLGFTSEAVDSVVRFAFRDLGLHRVEAACLPHNEASRRLLRRLGFQEEGYARGYLKIAGHWQDHILHALLREDRA